MKKAPRKQTMKHKRFIAATSHMYEVLFGEDPNDTCLDESTPEAKHLPNNTVLNDTSRLARAEVAL
ncbi:hypothetical protein [Burkholderia vietnamiensis]|uniref:hypothetical protein n=1 Tax=Burkholderia vietnamiensis TaxID=60552 RepID=UPI00352E42B7